MDRKGDQWAASVGALLGAPDVQECRRVLFKADVEYEEVDSRTYLWDVTP